MFGTLPMLRFCLFYDIPAPLRLSIQTRGVGKHAWGSAFFQQDIAILSGFMYNYVEISYL